MKSISNTLKQISFTQLLEDLVCNKKCGLQQALYILGQYCSDKKSGFHNRSIYKTSQYLYDTMLSGVSFCDALRMCPYIDFDPEYISFIGFAERCGNLEKTLAFLKQRGMRQKENLMRVAEACAYPLFIVIITIACGILMYSYSFSFTDISSLISSSLFYAFSFLSVFCVFGFVLIKKTLGEDKLYEAFLAAGFLIKGGESLANAVNNAVNILGYDSKTGQLFAQAGQKLSYGISLRDSFAIGAWNKSVRRHLDQAFFYAQNSGGEADVFDRIALWIGARDDRKRTFCLKLIEPFFILGTGVFLLIFLFNSVLPIFSQSTLLL